MKRKSLLLIGILFITFLTGCSNSNTNGSSSVDSQQSSKKSTTVGSSQAIQKKTNKAVIDVVK
ncbi:hypothetical protein [Enterococcus faecalis]|uniref:hypothetical protein n=1 Tax=Enterococcus faecalis TaxID=1351 RepID=UPI00041C2895|nr:hypothetical protein [Enterococcus faecalis]MCH1672739.1 hypothetical protein [Enterococcus faecalis]MDM3980271.1 hypothetical protein [Enterococcus faecalis]NSN40916.1 hypothetical protein [Enterococcus faecalis]